MSRFASEVRRFNCVTYTAANQAEGDVLLKSTNLQAYLTHQVCREILKELSVEAKLATAEITSVNFVNLRPSQLIGLIVKADEDAACDLTLLDDFYIRAQIFFAN